MRYRTCMWVFVATLILLTNGCYDLQQATIKSPYQIALESYYTALDSDKPEAINTALSNVSTILDQHPYDLESRMLRANIYVFQISHHLQGTDTARNMIKDLQIISESPGLVDSQDWVQARVYVTMGDYLLAEANRLASLSPENGKTTIDHVWAAKAYFEAARDYHAYAYSLESKKESGNACSGYVQALQGIVLTLDMINPKGDSAVVQNARAQSLEMLQKFYENHAAVTPGANVVSFDPVVHKSMRLTYRMLGDNLNGVIKEWCETHKDFLDKPTLSDDERKEIQGVRDVLEKRRLYLEYAATHAVVGGILDPGEANYDLDIQLLKNAYETDLKLLCNTLQ